MSFYITYQTSTFVEITNGVTRVEIDYCASDLTWNAQFYCEKSNTLITEKSAQNTSMTSGYPVKGAAPIQTLLAA